MWNVKPLTQPLTYTYEVCRETTDHRLECEIVKHETDSATYLPYSKPDPPRVGTCTEPFGHEVAEKNGLGMKRIQAGTELALPGVINPKDSGPFKSRMFLYDSWQRQKFEPDAGSLTERWTSLIEPSNLTGGNISGGKGDGKGNSGGMPT